VATACATATTRGAPVDLDRASAADLAAFFARRFPHAHQRQAIVEAARLVFREPAGGSALAAWGGLLTRAQEQAGLPRLAAAISKEMPEDENLQEVCDLLRGRRRGSRAPLPRGLRQLAAAGVLVGLAGVGVAAARGGASPEDPAMHAMPVDEDGDGAVPMEALSPPADGAAEPARAAPDLEEPAQVEPAQVEPAPVESAPVNASPVESAPVQTAPVEPSPVESAPAQAARPPLTPRAAPAAEPHTSRRCTQPEGGRVGYWYAGEVAPASAAGELVEIRAWHRVREDFPGTHNGFNARSPERCALMEGDRVRLTEAPIQVPGGAWWVPLHSGDLQPAG